STSECRGTDVVLGVIGLALSVVPSSGFVLLWHAQVREPASWECVGREISLEASRLRLVRRKWEWRCIDESRNGRDGLAAAWVALLEYRDLAYGALDAFVLVAVSCVSVVSGLTTSDAQCRGWSLVVMLVLVVQLALLVALR
ncbi:GPI-anchored surface protein, putative, partial [Bodo saltans]